MNPIIKLAGDLLPMAINTITSIVKDKKASKVGEANNIHENVAEGLQISSKRVMNVVGTPSLILIGVDLMPTQPKYGVIIIALGIIYCVGLSYVTHISEKE
jgi:CRISPR/Cas system CMR-associated protein Cmr3 (group 5 of RAMP superfamily)